MGLFDRKPGGFLDKANAWMTPERAAAFSAIGSGISQLGANQPVNLAPHQAALAQRQQRAEQKRALESSGLLSKFTPDQRAILAQMEPSAAQKIIAGAMFATPAGPTKGIIVDGKVINPITGEVIYAGDPKPDDLSEAEQEIARVMSTGYSREEAILVKEGILKVVTDPETKALVLMNSLTGQIIEPQRQIPDATITPPVVPSDVGLTFGTPFTGADTAFGAEGFGKRAANTLTDAVGLSQPFPETAAAQRDFSVMRESMTNKIADAYNGRVPAFILKSIQELTPDAGRIFEGPSAAQAKLNALGRNLEQELKSINRSMSRRLNPTDRESFAKRKQVLEDSIFQLETALQGFGSAGTNQTKSGVSWSVVE